MALGHWDINGAILAWSQLVGWGKTPCQPAWRNHLWQLGMVVAYNVVGNFYRVAKLAGRDFVCSVAHRCRRLCAAHQKGKKLPQEVSILPMTHVIEIPVKLSETILSDILITAFDGNYGGCWYWCEPEGFQVEGRNQGPAEGNHEDVWISVTVSANVQGDSTFLRRYEVTHKTVLEGIKLAMSGSHGCKLRDDVVQAMRDEDTGQIDADIADAIVQLGIWRKIRFA